MWTVFIWFRTQSSGRILWKQQQIFRFHNRKGIWLAVQQLSFQRFWSKEFVWFFKMENGENCIMRKFIIRVLRQILSLTNKWESYERAHIEIEKWNATDEKTRSENTSWQIFFCTNTKDILFEVTD
jgi:hypothetical protein